MAKQTFPVGAEPRIQLARISGDLTVMPWHETIIEASYDTEPREIQQDGNTLRIDGCDGDLTVRLPFGSAVSVEQVSGDCTLSDLRAAELRRIGGDVTVSSTSGPVDIESVSGDLTVRQAERLRLYGHASGNLTVSEVAAVEVEHVAGDMDMRDTSTARIGHVGSDFTARSISSRLDLGTVGSDCRVEDALEATLVIGTVGSDLHVNGAANLQIGTVGSDISVQAVAGNLEFGSIANDLGLADINGTVKGGSVADDAVLRSIGGSIEIGHIGGDLALEAALPADSISRLNVIGDAIVNLPATPNLRLRATVRGSASGPASLSGGGRLALDYGSGAALLEIRVGGDLALRGGGSPHSSSSSSGEPGDFADFERSMRDFGREMGELGRELGRLGQELGRELAAAFAEGGWSRGAGLADEIASNVERQKRRMEERAAEQARRAERVRVKINDREWQLDPERLERIKEQARRAAAEGLAGALETVERAINRMRPPAAPPAPGAPPAPAAPPTPATGVTIRIDSADQPGSTAEPSTAVPSADDRQRERATILHLVAAGRISPEEGDLLLEALER